MNSSKGNKWSSLCAENLDLCCLFDCIALIDGNMGWVHASYSHLAGENSNFQMMYCMY